MDSVKIFLNEGEMPRHWYNIQADLPVPMPPVIHPGTHQPIGPDDLAPLFPMGLIAQEVSQERYIEIPDEILDIYKIWRPTPLIRAKNWEKALGTPAKIYYKWEGVSPAGSHKPNTSIAQAWYNKEEGVKRITTETGAGQWGSALALACNFFGIECKVYMVRVSYDQKPYRRLMMQAWGATCIPSPSNQTNAGRKILETDPDTPGSLGIAISEAVEEAASRDDTKYSLGSVLNHVMLHQSIIGLESLKQFEMAGDYPDVIIGCAGGGSNFAGFAFPFVRDKIVDGKKTRVVAVEPRACPTLTKGLYKYDFGDTACTTPLIRMYTLGHDFVPAPLHAGGLRYHGMAPSVSHLYELGLIEARAYHQKECFDAALGFARTEGHLVAPETSHAVKAAMDEALACKESGEAKVIAFNASGHGHFDMGAYEKYFAGDLVDYDYPEEKVLEALAKLPAID
ncbi:MAG: TrpB-like pyridoxal phosphate-dependent enzyme [Longimicrobiales bacterium]|nr:TrpB-like pyridoxal phosphate-dependent enzyme [Longimicrobiales bacterium]